MIIDAHCHAGRGDGLTAPWNTAARLGPYLRRARAAGIGRTVVFPTFSSDYARANAEVARIVAHGGGRLIGFASIHPSRDAGRIGPMVEQAVRGFGFRGLKVHGLDAMPTREVCEAARAFRVPVLVDVANQPHAVEMLASEYPIDFIVAHLGSFGDDWKAHETIIGFMARFPNVYADTSGVRRFDYLLRAVRIAGPWKLLFGSDGPWLHPGAELHKVRLLGLASADAALVLGGNAARIIGLAPASRRTSQCSVLPRES